MTIMPLEARRWAKLVPDRLKSLGLSRVWFDLDYSALMKPLVRIAAARFNPFARKKYYFHPVIVKWEFD